MTPSQLLRQLIPGLLPLIIFVVVDSIWGTKVGLLVAVGVGLLELTYGLAKKQKPDKFMLLDLGLILAMGGVSLWLDNDLFFKLKPVVVGTMMCIMMAAMAFMPGNWLGALQQRYMPNVQINPWQQWEFKKSIRRMVWVLVAHTLATAMVSFAASNAVWGMVSGPGFFVAAGLWMLWEIVMKKVNQKKYAREEWLPLVNEEGLVVGQAPRSAVHGGAMLLHPVVHLHLLGPQGIYLQKRPKTKLVQPGKWDTAVGGHIAAGEPIEKALQRETYEEIGIRDFQASLLCKYVWESPVEKELVFSFISSSNVAPMPNPLEVDEGRFWSLHELDAELGRGVLTPNFEKEYSEWVREKCLNA